MSFLARGVVVAFLFAGCIDSDESSIDQASTGENGLHGAPEHVLKPKDAGSSGTSTDMTWHNGALLTANAPHKALTTNSAVAEACKMTNNNPDPNGVYFIYTSTGAGHVNYCAWHSYGNCSNGAPVQVAYMPNITGIAGCDPQDTSGLHSE